MYRKTSFVIGLLLISMGGIWLSFSLVGLAFGFRIWQLWPLFVISVGLAFVAPPLLTRNHPILGIVFIPGIPILATGMLLLIASVFHAWGIWRWLWPIEVIAVGLGFLSAALYMRRPGLLIPAIIISMNGLLFQFCALTGWWSLWAVAWTVEPLSVGLGLLTLNAFRPTRGLSLAGILLLGVALSGFALSVAGILLGFILPLSWVLRFTFPAALILCGVCLLGIGLFRRIPVAALAAE